MMPQKIYACLGVSIFLGVLCQQIQVSTATVKKGPTLSALCASDYKMVEGKYGESSCITGEGPSHEVSQGLKSHSPRKSGQLGKVCGSNPKSEKYCCPSATLLEEDRCPLKLQCEDENPRPLSCYCSKYNGPQNRKDDGTCTVRPGGGPPKHKKTNNATRKSEDGMVCCDDGGAYCCPVSYLANGKCPDGKECDDDTIDNCSTHYHEIHGATSDGANCIVTSTQRRTIRGQICFVCDQAYCCPFGEGYPKIGQCGAAPKRCEAPKKK